MASVNELNPRIDQSVRVFDDFYAFDLQVDANVYDVVNSFFESVFRDKNAAKNMTTSLFRVAKETNTLVLELLKQMQDQDAINVTASMAYYLNGLRSPSTLLGVNTPVIPNFYTARNVVI